MDDSADMEIEEQVPERAARDRHDRDRHNRGSRSRDRYWLVLLPFI